MMYLYESGNVFDNTAPVSKQDVGNVVELAKQALPSALQRHVIADIGSAGYKVESGDIDLFVDQAQVLKHYDVEDASQAKQLLKAYLSARGVSAVVKGRNVHASVEYTAGDGTKKHAQVDFMIIPNAKRVAPWHQHGPRGMYDDPGFKAGHLYILLNSLAKFKDMKVDAFAGTLNQRSDNSVVSDNRDQIAKILLNPGATGNDLNSVATVMRALEGDPDKEGKLAQAQQDVQKGVLTLPETSTPGTAAWFRKLGYHL
jgi:hypothetical protein